MWLRTKRFLEVYLKHVLYTTHVSNGKWCYWSSCRFFIDLLPFPSNFERSHSLFLMTKEMHYVFCFVLFCFFRLFAFYRADPVAHGGSQSGGLIVAVAASLHQSHSNAGSSAHWARPGIKPATSWFLVGFVNHCATTGTPEILIVRKNGKIWLTRFKMPIKEYLSEFPSWRSG